MNISISDQPQLCDKLVAFVHERTNAADELAEKLFQKHHDQTGRWAFTFRNTLYKHPNLGRPGRPYIPLDVSLHGDMLMYLEAKAEYEKDTSKLRTFFNNAIGRAVTKTDLKALLPAVLHPAINDAFSFADDIQTLSEQEINLFKVLNKRYYARIAEFELHKLVTG